MEDLNKEDELKIEEDIKRTKKKMRIALIVMVVALIVLGFFLYNTSGQIFSKIMGS
ncbi:MAG: hypothetical protein ACRDCB_03830 [Clostridium sp.]|uniref:hypothetical protein n=1 Tax=Clostridium TaxID=1485 RepID=UPI0018845E0F|nr:MULTISPECIES: hypothetical protein [Clostridium]MCR6514227.1 hypothetical protein [Clostridium sp. LY3-2]